MFENQPTFNLFPEIFAIDIPFFCTSSILNQINCRDNSLAIVGNWIRLLGINAPRLQGGRMANTFANLSNFIFWPRLPSFLNCDLLKLLHDLIDGIFQEAAWHFPWADLRLFRLGEFPLVGSFSLVGWYPFVSWFPLVGWFPLVSCQFLPLPFSLEHTLAGSLFENAVLVLCPALPFQTRFPADPFQTRFALFWTYQLLLTLPRWTVVAGNPCAIHFSKLPHSLTVGQVHKTW